ncbi:MAG: hypothetical protein PVH88_04450 [Ignavibacteria bacterium]|jgi:hypothetical protein
MEYTAKDISALYEDISDSLFVKGHDTSYLSSGSFPCTDYTPSCYWKCYTEDGITYAGEYCEDKPSWYDECNNC